jgi:hypothetical protein
VNALNGRLTCQHDYRATLSSERGREAWIRRATNVEHERDLLPALVDTPAPVITMMFLLVLSISFRTLRGSPRSERHEVYQELSGSLALGASGG